MTIVYRQARADDLERTDALVVASINDLTQRHGFGKIAVGHPLRFQNFSLKDDPEGLWVAEENGEILGFAWAWVTDDLWFLAQLFVSPERQGAGIGDELITRTLAHAERSGAKRKALITFSFNTVSQGLYIRHGLLPRFPIYSFSAPRDRTESRLPGAQLRHTPLDDKADHLKLLRNIDMAALGASREKHHKFLLADIATKGFLFYEGHDCVAYAYISTGGHIGPLAVAKPTNLGPAFVTALKLAVQGNSQQVSAFVPGTADPVLDMATKAAMRITLPMMLMATRNVADCTQYLPRNPGFM